MICDEDGDEQYQSNAFSGILSFVKIDRREWTCSGEKLHRFTDDVETGMIGIGSGWR